MHSTRGDLLAQIDKDTVEIPERSRMHPRSLLSPLFLIFLTTTLAGQSLKVATLNLWTGSDYRGVWRIGEYESPEMREHRFQIVVRELQSIRPDVIALQEVNPAGMLTKRLASILDYDYVYQRVNSGLKVGHFGIPWNLNEGVAILARKNLDLQPVDVYELSDTFGAFGDIVSFHSGEKNVALVARIRFQNKSIAVLNIHIAAVVPYDTVSIAAFNQILDREGVRGDEKPAYLDRVASRALVSEDQLARLSDYLQNGMSQMPRILMGDLNVTSTSDPMHRFLASSGLVDVVDAMDSSSLDTWDPGRNDNIEYSLDSLDASQQQLPPIDRLGAWYDGQHRRIDYILTDSTLNRPNRPLVRRICDRPDQGVYASDHYGLLADIPTANLESFATINPDSLQPVKGSELEPFPILSYDTDVGLGYGAKVFYLNPFGQNESFDLVLFNSTRGERWYRFVYSIPDFEVRQGSIYSHAFDLVVDYDKYLRNSFFGVGNQSRFAQREYYTREPLEISLVFSRGFSTRTVLQTGIKYKVVTNFPLSDTSQLKSIPPSLNSSTARSHALFVTYRYDSRNSFINPSHGFVLQGEAEYAPQSTLTNISFGRVGVLTQYYVTLFHPRTIFALRLGMQGLIGGNLPVQMLLPIGGNQTVRGSPQDRYLDRNSAVMNAEIRFPIFWRIGGVFGYDAGKVWHQPKQFDLERWSTNPVVGLRFFMDTFVVRADLGFGQESTGFYLNFGHLF